MDNITLNNKTIHVDGNTINKNVASVYRGLGVVSGNNSSRLMIDYKQEHPKQYWDIMNFLFKEDYGAGLTHIKIELGADVNSSSGTEPSTMRYSNERPNVHRGAGFIFIADALTINPNITTDLLRWGEPKWVTDEFSKSNLDGYIARYKWYKSTIDTAFKEFNIKFTHISADSNETGEIDTNWIVYLSNKLKSETNSCYDYSKIKIIASDEVQSWKIADEMLKDENLLNAVDILGEHYNTFANDNVKTLNTKYHKEVWYSEGIASMNNARLSVNSNGSGITGINGCLDVCNRIINGYSRGRMTMYEYQPAVASYYDGARYFPKSLILANEPWCGYYELDANLWISGHFTMFAKNGWQFIDSACFGDGEENHAIWNTTHNYMTLTNPDTKDYSIIVCNDSSIQRNYTFEVSNLDKSSAMVYVWETVGRLQDNQPYDINYLRKISSIQPTSNNDGSYSYSVEVKPYSIVTITTLQKDNISIPSQIKCDVPSKVLSLPCIDDFNYSNEYIFNRGGTPKYTTDQSGAFEVVNHNGKNILMQMISYDIKPTEWRFGHTPNPITTLGDDRWSNYSVSSNVQFAENSLEDNYIGVGTHYIFTDNSPTAESGYSLKLYYTGAWELLKDHNIISNGRINSFNSDIAHNIEVITNNNQISAIVDNSILATYTDTICFINSGRASLLSGYYNNIFYNIVIKPINDIPYYITRIDDHDAKIVYTGNWIRTIPSSFADFNRTISSIELSNDDTNLNYFEFEFIGTEFSLIGSPSNSDFQIILDDEISIEHTEPCTPRKVFFKKTSLDYKNHTLKVVVTNGKFILDAIEYL